jgi:indolepyruvate ferredoxin oxidoreductase
MAASHSAWRRRSYGEVRLSFHLAPPLFAKRDPVTGHLIKQEFGPWMMRVFRLLARLKGLRGTAFDPFGRTAERRAERALIDDYERMMRGRLKGLTAPRIAGLVKLAAVPDMIRGYGHVKEQAMAKANAARARLEAELDAAAYAVAAE